MATITPVWQLCYIIASIIANWLCSQLYSGHHQKEVIVIFSLILANYFGVGQIFTPHNLKMKAWGDSACANSLHWYSISIIYTKKTLLIICGHVKIVWSWVGKIVVFVCPRLYQCNVDIKSHIQALEPLIHAPQPHTWGHPTHQFCHHAQWIPCPLAIVQIYSATKSL